MSEQPVSVPVFVPIVLTEDEAKAVANAAAYAFTVGRGLLSPDHPVFTGALKIEEALEKACPIVEDAER